MRSSAITVLALLASLTAAGCNKDDLSLIPRLDGTVSILDQCEPTSFNAVLGAGACTGHGTMTLAQFTAELAANHSVAAWRFDPAALTLTLGGSITATNYGGEVHTFTEVDEFGGGFIPELNDLSGTPVPAPECIALTQKPGFPFIDELIPAGGKSVAEDEDAGTHHYQCCIHPWMRMDVTVR